jgi:dTDP-4-amino-4,6-dideoxygalactose transaminase
MENVMDIAAKYGLKVVEDAAESLGSFYAEGPYKGRHTGAIGDIGICSFNGNKIVTAGGGEVSASVGYAYDTLQAFP